MSSDIVLTAACPKTVCRHLELKEEDLFGLKYIDIDGNERILRPDDKLPQINEMAINKECGSEYCINFGIIIHPELIEEELFEDSSRRMLFCQTRKLILSGAVYCDPKKAFTLAGLLAHVDLGPYQNDSVSGTVDPFVYLPIEVCGLYKPEVLKKSFEKQYELFRDFSTEEAILEYLTIVEDFDMYKVNYFQVVNQKCHDAWIGIHPLGISIYSEDNKIVPMTAFEWNELTEFGYSPRAVEIKTREKTVIKFVLKYKGMGKDMAYLCSILDNLYYCRRKADSATKKLLAEKAKKQKELRNAKRQCRRAKRLQQQPAINDDQIRAIENQVQANLEQLDSKISDLQAAESSQKTSKSKEKSRKDKKAEIDNKGAPVADVEKSGDDDVYKQLETIQQAKLDMEAEFNAKLKQLQDELDAKWDESKLQPNDKIFVEHAKSGMNKYMTLRAIKKGSVKARLDMYEAL